MLILSIFTLLVLKHFIIDFPLQTPYQWMNKGKYAHPGGILHAGLHGLGTMIVFAFFVVPQWVIILGLIDLILHYHIDYLKVNINQKYGWSPDQHPEFWVLLGLDQLLHYLTYCLLVWIIL